MTKRSFRSLSDVAAGMRPTLPPGDVAEQLRGAFHLPPGALSTKMKGDLLTISTSDKTVRFALSGLEPEILRMVQSRGFKNVKRVSWSAE
jgi:hypothetical protein